jgi:sialate O-acetylesterase
MVTGGPDVDTGVYPHYVSPGTKGGKPEIRIVQFGAGASMEPEADVRTAYRARDGGKWKVMAEDPPAKEMNLAEYSARVIRDGVDVPVGIVQIAVPGTNQAAWMSKETLEKFPSTKGKGNFYEEFLGETQSKLNVSDAEIKSWDDFKKAMAEKGQAPGPVQMDFANFPTALYNTRVHPVAPLSVRGVMWHQGEAGPTGAYGERLVAMVKQWRELFGQDFHFVWGTLSRGTTEPPPLSPVRLGFYRSNNNLGIRKAEELFGKDGKATLVELYDLGNNVTHFLAKAEAGRRMGLAAMTEVYGQKHVYTGPRMVETKIEGGKARITFSQVGDGIVYEPSINGISGVYVSGKGGPAKWGVVKVVDAKTIEVSHPEIAAIETVAYADFPNPHETLFNSARLPASPFVVNPVKANDPKGMSLLATVGGEGKADWHVAHVRRSGYVFKVAKGRTVRAFIPAEWKGCAVECGGKAVAGRVIAEDGATVVTFEVPAAGEWIIVAEKGKAEDFRGVNRL